MAEARAAFPSSFGGLFEACVSFHRKSKDGVSEERARSRRAELARFAKLFHSECGTLTSGVQESLDRLSSGDCIVLMTAHQPNFFAYSGVLRKATLNFVLAKKLEACLHVPVVSFFGIADQDFTDDRWVRSCELPSVLRTGGVLSVEEKLPEKLMLNKVAKPSREMLLAWEIEVNKWLDDAVKSVVRLCKTAGFQDALSGSTVSALSGNLSSFWRMTEDCWVRSKNVSDFNGFLMSKIVNDCWQYDTVFARFSECQQAFADDFSFLLSRFDDYSRFMKEAMDLRCGGSLSGGVSDQEPYLVPFWYHCGCGSKVKLFLDKKDGHMHGSGTCIRCQEYYDLDLGQVESPMIDGLASQISARAIPMALVFFRGLQPSCYVGGAGGAGYLAETELIARGLGISFPPIVVWRPRDRYVGVGQAEALLELRRVRQYLGARSSSEARALLTARLSEARDRLGELEKLKGVVVEKLRKSPGDEEIKREMSEILMERASVMRSSNLSVLSHDLKILENAFNALDMVPSIIDYAVNCGLKETSCQWIRYLTENGGFCSDVEMESVFDLPVNSEGIG